jgi:chain length determinant protein EpsF
MTLDQFFRIVRARWMLVLAITATITLLVAAFNIFVLPKKYTSTASVMVDNRPDPVTALSAAAGLAGSYLATQIDVIESQGVAQRVVRALHIDAIPEMRKNWEKDTQGKGDYVAWLADTIGKGLTIKPSRESNVIDIVYEGIDPNFSAAMANAFAQAYIDTTVSAKTTPAKRYEEFFEERAKLARQKLEKAQDALAAAQQAKGLVATDARLDFENARLNDIASQITALRALKAESSSRANALANNPDDNQDVLTSGLISSLKAEQARQEGALKLLNERLGDAHPSVIEARAQLSDLRRRIRDETARITSGLHHRVHFLEALLAQLVREFDDQRNRVLELNEQRSELQVMEREVEIAQKLYDSIQSRLTQTSLESNSTESPIYLLSAATVAAHSSSPRVFINTFVAMGLGFLFSLIIAMLVELFDRRVRGPFDLVQVLELPVLGVLPNGRRPAGGLRGLLASRTSLRLKGKSNESALVVSP